MNFVSLPFQNFVRVLPLLLIASVLNGQSLSVNSGATAPYTPQNLISNVLLGDGVEVTNIQYKGKPAAVGYFSGGQQSIGLERGIVITTGIAESENSDNGADRLGNDFSSEDNNSTAYDADLADLTTADINNVAVYTITFIPTSDTLRFRYCFASEEYPEYGCSDYNDVFGFFIQGPGYPIATNIAKVPGTNLPVAINNIHPQNPNDADCTPLYVQYFNDNNMTNKQPTYDGFTDVFTAIAVVQPCQEYTIKLAIADVFDNIYDSGVFLEAKSFGTGSLKAEIATVSPEGIVSEGCAEGMLTFKLPAPADEPFVIDYKIWGTAINGTDYETIPINITIPAGQSEIKVPIVALEDGLTESGEFIAIDYQRDICRRDTVFIYLRDNTIKAPSLRQDTSLCVSGAASLDLDATLPIVIPPAPSFSNTTDQSISLPFIPYNSTINVSGVQPTLLGKGVIKSVCLNVTHPWVDDLDIYLIAPDGQFIALSTDNGGNGDNYTQTCFTPTATKAINFPGPFAPASAAPFTGEWLPEGVWSDLYGYKTNGAWKLQLIDDAFSFNGSLLDWSITFEPTYKVDYQWYPIDHLSCPTCPKTVATPEQTTTYHVIATDTYGCMVSDSVQIEVNQTLAAPPITCQDVSSSSLSFAWETVTGAQGYEINIDGAGWVPAAGAFDYSVNNLQPGTSVTLQVRATTNQILPCPPVTGSATCTTCIVPGVQSNITPVSCFGQTNGAVTITTDNQNPPYTFKLGTLTNATGAFTGLAAGDYSASITNGDGCTAILPITIPTPQALTANATTLSPITCNGMANGQATVAFTGGTAPVSFRWSDNNAQTTQIATGLAAGNYSVTLTDANGCTKVSGMVVSQPQVLLVGAVGTDTKCFGDANGTALASAAGGVAPYNYNWSNGQTTIEAQNLAAGSYSMTVTDANLCSKTSSVTIGQPTEITATVTNTPTKCFGGNDGTATVQAAGGASNFTYQWSGTGGQTTANATNLSPQTYTVTIKDQNNCSITKTTTIAQPPVVSLTVSATPALCNGSATGTATAIATGGTGSFTYSWNSTPTQTSPTAQNLAFGNYTVTASDQNGCTSSKNANITQPAPIVLTANATDAKCFGNSDGAINLSASGGTTPYQYAWNNSGTSQNLSGIPFGTYIVTVSDANSCTKTLTESIAQPSEITTVPNIEAVKCHGENTGKISISISGGIAGYEVKWFGPNNFTATGSTQSDLTAGTYNLTVTDANNCKKIGPILLPQPAEPLLSRMPDIGDTVCYGTATGIADSKAAGGTAPYTYQWNVGTSGTPSIGNLPIGIYVVTITDANNCQITDSTFIAQQPQIFTWLEMESPSCHDGEDGKMKVKTIFYAANSANLDEFSYTWNTEPPQTSLQAINLKAEQTYMVTVMDAQGCTATQTATVGNPNAVFAKIDSFANVKCYNENNGWAIVSGSGGKAPYTYLWNQTVPIQLDSLGAGMSAGLYIVTVTDANGCFVKKDIVINQPAELKPTLSPIDVTCYNESNGKIKAIPTGGIPGYQFLWHNGATTAELTNLSAGTTTVTITDKNGCTTIGTANIKQPDSPLGATTQKKDAKCFRDHNGEIIITGNGGTPPYKYSIDGSNWNGSTRQIGLYAGTYKPYIKDFNNCVQQLDEVVINERGALEVDLGPDITIPLGTNTQLNAIVSNAIGPIEYIWSSEDSIWLSCMDCPNPFVDSLYYQNSFELYIVDSLGCSAEDRIVVLVEKIRKVFVPTGFSPNDDLTNDVLLTHGQDDVKVLQFRVYDRWGEVVYEANDFDLNDPNVGWDGTFRGKPMDPGVFVWTLEVLYIDGIKEVFKGNTTLIR